MAGEHDSITTEETVDPGVSHPGGGPAAAGGPAPADPLAGEREVSVSPPPGQAPPHGEEPPAPVEEPQAPPAPAGDPEAPVGPTAPAGDPPADAPPTGDPEPAAEPVPAGEPDAPVGPTGPSMDLETLAARADKADEYLELAKRTKADFENYRKRASRDVAAAQERGIARLVRELLPAIDNLDRAVQAAETAVAGEDPEGNGTATLASGIKLVHADVLAALQRAGVQRYSPQGEPFDPQRHEAIAQHPVDGAQPGTVVEVYQQGYLLGEAVIRPARVVVAG